MTHKAACAIIIVLLTGCGVSVYRSGIEYPPTTDADVYAGPILAPHARIGMRSMLESTDMPKATRIGTASTPATLMAYAVDSLKKAGMQMGGDAIIVESVDGYTMTATIWRYDR